MLLSVLTVVFLSLDGAARGNERPSTSIAPGMTDGLQSGDWDSVLFTKTFDEGVESQTRRPKLPAASAGWTRQALITGSAAFAFLISFLV